MMAARLLGSRATAARACASVPARSACAALLVSASMTGAFCMICCSLSAWLMAVSSLLLPASNAPPAAFAATCPGKGEFFTFERPPARPALIRRMVSGFSPSAAARPPDPVAPDSPGCRSSGGLDDVRFGEVRLGDVRLGDVRLGDVRLGDVTPGGDNAAGEIAGGPGSGGRGRG